MNISLRLDLSDALVSAMYTCRSWCDAVTASPKIQQKLWMKLISSLTVVHNHSESTWTRSVDRTTQYGFVLDPALVQYAQQIECEELSWWCHVWSRARQEAFAHTEAPCRRMLMAEPPTEELSVEATAACIRASGEALRTADWSESEVSK